MICPICKEKLINDIKRVYCVNNHSFDKAKSGYINLLLNSPSSGDNKLMIDSREKILSLGYYDILANKILEVIKKYEIKSVLDCGCGEGYYVKHIKDNLDIKAYGMDISKYACLKASKQSTNITYVVASVSDIPFSNNEFDAMLSNFAPVDETEFERVASKYIIKIIPNKHHLIEVKNYLYEETIIKDSKVPQFMGFDLIEEINLNYKKYVMEVLDLVRMTPYYYRTKINEAELINYSSNVTFDFKLLVYKKTGE